MGAVTLVNENGEFQTYKFTLMSEHGIKSELKTRLKFAKNIIDHLIKKPWAAQYNCHLQNTIKNDFYFINFIYIQVNLL